MDDNRTKDRRKKKTKISNEKRKGPRRLVCTCGGKVEVKLEKNSAGSFECLRCGKKHS